MQEATPSTSTPPTVRSSVRDASSKVQVPDTPQLTCTGTLIAYHWENESDDAQMIAWGRGIVANLTEKAKAAGLYYPFIYMNDAAAGEKPFPLYGKGKSLPRLKAIQRKYDPQNVLRNLEASGFKLDA